MSNIPKNKPQIRKEDLLLKLKALHPDFVLPDFFVLGIRGYYKITMGDPTKNDRKIYDDAIFLIGKNEFFAYNGNTDPAAFRQGIATLKPGIWPAYTFSLHKGTYLALCQRGGMVTVFRDGQEEDTGYFGINIHMGGINSTSSEGCQTIPKPQWPDFIKNAQLLAAKYYGKDWKKKVYTYTLIEL
ncbi:MAG: hypothetical protein IPJ81_15995 [Chitinophagaceae bacterium]|nr:hypothetical protein [Chitinophagaceae bacterium]